MTQQDPLAIASINPSTGEIIKLFEPMRDEEISSRIRLASETFRTFRHLSFRNRAEKMMRLAGLLESEKRTLGALMTMEMGKTIVSAIQEIEKCAWACRYFAEHAETFLADEPVTTNATRSFVRYQPLGPILAIMPWNFPFWQVLRFAVPAMMAGNVVLLKHAPNVPQCALVIEELFHRAEFPDGAFQSLLMRIEQVPVLLHDERIKAVTLTGSVGAGSSVAAATGTLIKKTVLELGGSDPCIVMPSANFLDTIAVAVKARTINNGQSCIAAKRFIIHEDMYETWIQQFSEAMQSLRVGDPMDEKTDVGPLARPDLLERLDRQVQTSVAMGARVVVGGTKLNRRGYYYSPTVLTDISKNALAYTEELFGPVAAVFRVKNIDEAIRVANDTAFGLGASAWTNDKTEQERCIDEIESGAVFINGMVVSDPRLPFGGVKHSGYGRELGIHGIREFVNIKTIWIKDGAGKNITMPE